MNRQITIRRLLAIVMIAGLVLAPLSRPVMAGAASDASMPAMADDMSMSAMAGDMPCCPSKAPAPVDCDKCVLMTACMSKCFTGMSATVLQPFLIASDNVASLQNESWPEGLGHPPPEHPPRTLT